MSAEVDPVVRLALALGSSRGAFAVLVGSGLSAAAGVPTGRQILTDLIAKLAALQGSPVGEDAFGWYRATFGEEPDYSKLLDALATSPTQRNELLRGYFEPSPEQRRRGLRVPTVAHRALAEMAARGYVAVFVTTNFDRLLEQALERAGVSPSILSTPDALEGMLPLGRSRCTLLKLHGDYLDTRIKNTPAELDDYHPSVDRLLDRILDEYGLIVCGWSADWDTALRRAFERAAAPRYPTFWASRNPAVGEAARLVELRQAEVVRIKDANTFFVDVLSRLSALERSSGQPGTSASQAGSANLPTRAAGFVGRRAELIEITERLRDPSVRLLTLFGPGGTGKTTLAIESANAAISYFPDGVIFVDLSTARNAEDVLVAIVRSIGLQEQTDREMKAQLVDHLRERHLLLVLDNFEQVVSAAGLVAELIGECPQLHVLVTSREALRLRAEHVYPVPPLALPPVIATERTSADDIARYEAVQLFADRARAVLPAFALTDDNASQIAEICRRLDGLPLAIELAAARLRLFSPEALRDQLRNRLESLGRGPRDLPERQQTLRATVDWSYQLLDPEEQRLFELLSVFAGADVVAVEAVATEAAPDAAFDVLDRLAGLIEKSLIRRVDVTGSGSRIAMLETMRSYAADRLEEHAEFAARARAAHASYYAELVNRLQPELAGHARLDALATMAADVENLRIAWRYWVAARDFAQLEKLAVGILTLNDTRGWPLDTVVLATDLLALLEKAPSSPERTNKEIAIRTLLARALMTAKGYTPEVEEAFATSVELFERGTERESQFSALRELAAHYNFRGDTAKGAPIAREVLKLAERENDPAMLIEGHLLVGATGFIEDLQGALDQFEAGISLVASVPRHAFNLRSGGADPRVACYAVAALTMWQRGLPDPAVGRMNAALDLATELDHPFTTAFARFHSGLLHLWRRDFEVVLNRSRALLDVADDHGFAIWKAAGTALEGAAQVGLGDAEEGLANVRRGMELYQGRRSPPVFWPLLLGIHARACLEAGRTAEGLQSIDSSLSILNEGGGPLLCELRILKGDLLRAGADSGSSAGAESCYRRALETATVLGARISALRAATRLLRSAQTEEDRSSARRALTDILSAFTESPTSRDVLEAQELLGAGD